MDKLEEAYKQVMVRNKLTEKAYFSGNDLESEKEIFKKVFSKKPHSGDSIDLDTGEVAEISQVISNNAYLLDIGRTSYAVVKKAGVFDVDKDQAKIPAEVKSSL